MRIALAFKETDCRTLKHHRPDLLLIPPGIALDESHAAQLSGCIVRNLNRYTSVGAIVESSRRTAPLIRRFMDVLDSPPIEAISSQNDLYQYHLRLQHYFLAALERAIREEKAIVLILAERPYPRYWSPLRPELGRLHDFNRTNALLAVRLAERIGLRVELPRQRVREVELFVRRVVRAASITAYRWYRLARKCVTARRELVSKSLRDRSKTVANARPVAIIVRTDSEVVSAKFLCDALARHAVEYVLIRDELLSSQTTISRLAEFALPFVSIGSSRGLPGLLQAYWQKPRKLAMRNLDWPRAEDVATEVMQSPDVWSSMRRRLLDFSLDQKHLAIELSDFIRVFNFRALVTFAYVDQWGALIRDVGDRCGIPTLAIQNAAQDPEEYPRLCWAAKYCVESLRLKNRLIGLGYPPADIVATGLPQFSGTENPRDVPEGELRERSAIAILTQPIYTRYFEQIISGAAQVAARNGMRLIVKYHPRQQDTDYSEAIATARSFVDVETTQRESLDAVLSRSTLVISVVSAALIRAIYVGIPSFSLLPVEEQYLDLDYVRHPVTHTAEDVETLALGMEDFLHRFSVAYAGYLVARTAYLSERARFEPTQVPSENICEQLLKLASR